jgi:hypothetical protein
VKKIEVFLEDKWFIGRAAGIGRGCSETGHARRMAGLGAEFSAGTLADTPSANADSPSACHSIHPIAELK